MIIINYHFTRATVNSTDMFIVENNIDLITGYKFIYIIYLVTDLTSSLDIYEIFNLKGPRGMRHFQFCQFLKI